MPSSSDFQAELDSIFAFAEQKRLVAVTMKSGDLHRLVGGYPGKGNRLPICCRVVRDNRLAGDKVLSAPPRGEGATLIIRYKFPRESA